MTLRLAVTLLLSAILGLSQTPAFDAATVKPTDPANPELTAMRPSPGRLRATGSLRDFLKQAYGVEDSQIFGKLDAARYDIDARFPRTTTLAERNRMLQALLAERFRLQLHREQRSMPVYTLAATKNGPKLHQAEGNAGASMGPAFIRGNLSLDDLARMLAPSAGRMVINQTGLTAIFAIKLEWMPEQDSIFTVIQEQLGLKLEPAKAPIEVLVVDHAEPPSAD